MGFVCLIVEWWGAKILQIERLMEEREGLLFKEEEELLVFCL